MSRYMFGRHRRCCCCGVKTGTYLAGSFTLVTSSLQLVGQLSVYGVLDLWDILKYDAKIEASDDNKMAAVYHQVPRAYMTLAGCDALMIILSLLLLLGNAKSIKPLMQGWFTFVVVYIIYETAVNILFFINVFKQIAEQMHPNCVESCDWLSEFGLNLSLPLLCYWLIKLTLNLSGLYTVWYRIKEIRDDRYMDLPYSTEFERIDYV